MQHIKGLTALARHTGATRAVIHHAIRQGELPTTRVAGVNIVPAAAVAGFRHDREALPAWENEGGACRPQHERTPNDQTR